MSAGDGNACDGGMSPASLATPRNDIEEGLRDEIQRGLGALRRERPEAHVAARQGNHLFVSLGSIDLSAFDGYEEDEADAYVRVPHQFPHGNPYGIVTVPPLTLADSDDLPAQDLNHNNGRPLGNLVDGDFGWWSFRWQNVRVEQGEDLAKALELVRSHIRRWEDGDGH